jgi:hypothetical protein
MEFIVGFPLTARRHHLNFVVVNTLTKSAQFITVCTMYKLPYIARDFFNYIKLCTNKDHIQSRIDVYKMIFDQFPRGFGNTAEFQYNISP